MKKEHSEGLEDIRFLLEHRSRASADDMHYRDIEGVFALLKRNREQSEQQAKEDARQEDDQNEADQEIIIEFATELLVPDEEFSEKLPALADEPPGFAEELQEDHPAEPGTTHQHSEAEDSDFALQQEKSEAAPRSASAGVSAEEFVSAAADDARKESAAGATLRAAFGVLLQNQLSAGIDVGSAFLKYIGLRATPGGALQVQSVLLDELRGIEEVEDAQETVSRRYQYVADKLRGRFRSTDWVVSAVAGLEVIYKRIALPKMSKKELREAVPWAARKDLPFEVEDAILDFQVLGTVREGKGEKIEIATLATPQQIVMDHLGLFRALGVIPAKITGIPVAVRNVICRSKTLLKQRVLVLEVGARSTHMIFINQGRLEFHREFSTAADDLFEAFCSSSGLAGTNGPWSREQARELFEELGLPLDEEQDARWQERALEDISANVRTVIDRLISEIRRSVDYYRDKFKSSGFDAVFLSGGGAHVRHLLEHVSIALDQQVEVLNPFEVAGIRKWQEVALLRTQPARFTVALGLALDKNDSLNLLPAELKGAHRIRRMKKFLRYAAAASVLALSMITAYFSLQLNRFSADLQRLQQEYQRLVPRQNEYVALKKRLEELQAVASGYQSEIFVNTTAKSHLQALSHLVSRNLALTSVIIEPVLPEEGEEAADEESPPGNERITISGIAFPDQALEGAHLADFLLRLERSGYFQEVHIKNRETRADGTIQFVVQCYY